MFYNVNPDGTISRAEQPTPTSYQDYAPLSPTTKVLYEPWLVKVKGKRGLQSGFKFWTAEAPGAEVAGTNVEDAWLDFCLGVSKYDTQKANRLVVLPLEARR